MIASKHLHILHIEDDETQAEKSWTELFKCGLDFQVSLVKSRESYEEALNRGDVDIVLCDYSGEDFEGEEALHYVRAHFPGMPFVFVSASYTKRDPELLKAAGAVECLLKGQLRGIGPAVEHATGETVH